MSLRAAELAGHDQRNVTGQPLEINVEKIGEHVDFYRQWLAHGGKGICSWEEFKSTGYEREILCLVGKFMRVV